MSENKHVFRPVRGTEEAIKANEAIEGYVYFTTDTKKIYQGLNGTFVPMGGNSGIYYATKTLSEEEQEADTVDFLGSDIEGENLPQEDDLILNAQDAFYRVSSVNQDDVEVVITGIKMIMAGGGISSGPGGSVVSKPVLKDIDNNYQKYFPLDSEKMLLSIICTSTIPDNHIEEINISIGNNLIVENNNGRGYDFENQIDIDLIKYLNYLSTSNVNTIYLQVVDEYGNMSTKKPYKVSIIDIALESNTDNINKVSVGNNFTFYYTPRGGNSLKDHRVEVSVMPKDSTSEVQPFVVVNDNPMLNNENPQVIDMSTCTHGVYTVKATYYGTVPDSDLTISSNEIVTTVICQDESNNTPLIATYLEGREFQQYSTVNIQYMIIDSQVVTETEDVKLIVDDNVLEDKAYINNQLNVWRQPFTATGNYSLSIGYKNITEALDTITITPYEGDIPVINLTDANLIMYLHSQDHLSNSSSDKEIWSWKGHNGKFENFLWGSANGWITDEEDVMALKLTNGAKFTMPTFKPFEVDATTTGMTIDLDFSINGTTDYSKPIIHCVSKATSHNEKTFNSPEEYKTGVYYIKNESNEYVLAEGAYDETLKYYERVIKPTAGFEITGQKIMLNSSVHQASTTEIDGAETADGTVSAVDAAVQGFTQFFNEGDRIHLTYVIQRIATQNSSDFYFVYTYVNGILSGIMRMDSNEQFIESGTPAIFTCDSTYADINLYNFRVYTAAYGSRTIINNYISDISNIDDKIEKNKDNNIYTNNGSINLSAIQDLSYQLKVPYVLFNGGCAMKKKKTDNITYTSTSGINFDLPYTKSDYRLMSMKMYDAINPERNIDIPISLKDTQSEEIVSKFEDIKIGTTYKPVRGVQVYGQGTSSMVYPVKNLRLRFIQEDDYPTVYDGSYPCEIICFKADFMDSSSSHNTGTANLVYDLLTELDLKTPPQKFLAENYDKLPAEQRFDITTAIRGYPIICFFAEEDSDEYTYIGRYNFNIDKATPEPFGFPGMKVYTGKTTTDENGIERKEVKACGLKTEVVNGMTVLPITEAEDENGNIIEGQFVEKETELTQCWEMKNNDADSPVKFLTLKGYDSFLESLNAKVGEDQLPNWLGFYEDRYPDEIVGDAEDGKDTSEATAKFFELCDWLNSTQLFDGDGNKLFETGIISEDEWNERRNKFINEFDQHLDRDFTLFYYCLTMILLMMDSRAKNMMIASWDQEKWYPIFYDMDSMLGLNNTGVNKYTFSIEDEIEGRVFNGYDSVLWNNTRECFYSDICKFYANMRNNGGLNLGNLLKTYNENSADKWNEALCTADAEYKYIRPYKEGYLDGKNLDDEGNPTVIEPGKVNYLYAGQGRRSNHRAWWLKNRLSYLDSKYWPIAHTGETIAGAANSLQFRAYNVPKQGESGVASDNCLAQTPADHKFALTALNDSYQSWYNGSNLYGPVYTAAGQTAVIGPDSPNSEVESYILNTDLISNLGDLSNKYLGQPLKFPNTEMKITSLNLGRSKRSHPTAYDKYYNGNLIDLNIGSACPYLQNLNIARCTALSTLNLEDCKRLMVLDAEGCTSLSAITFPKDSILRELYLPANLNQLSLINQPNLTTIEFDSTSGLNSLELEDVPALDSYPLVKSVFIDNLNISESGATKYFRLININWIIDENSINAEGKIERIDILENLLSTKVKALNNADKRVSLSGVIKIAVPNAKVDEFEIYNRYHKQFPNLVIEYDTEVSTVTKAISIQFMRLEEYSENNTVFYQTYAPAGNTTQTLERLTAQDGPNGTALGIPTKNATVENTYGFKAWDIDFSTVPNSDMVIYPIYYTVVREYQINFYNYDNSLEFSEALPYNSQYTVNNYAYRDSSDLAEDERWAFQGWTTTNYNGTSVTNPEFINPENMVVKGPFNAYAFYKKEKCREVTSKLEYFNFSPSYTTHISSESGSKNFTGYQISLKDQYKYALKGKITLPVSYNGQPIVSIGNFSPGASGEDINITHIFFNTTKEESHYVEVANSAFQTTESGDRGYNYLKYIDLPLSILQIGSAAFEGCMDLETIVLSDSIINIGTGAFKSSNFGNAMKLAVNELPKDLETLGVNAFLDGGDNVVITKLPKKLKVLSAWSLAHCPKVTIKEFGNWSSVDDPNSEDISLLKQINGNCLDGSGTSLISEIYVGDSVTTVQRDAFKNYGDPITTAYLAYPEKSVQYSELSAAEIGFNLSKTSCVFSHIRS